MTLAAAKCTACWLDPQARSRVTPGIASGQPAASTASLPTLVDWSAIWVTQPQMMSSISSGSSWFLAASAVSTDADRSTGCTPLSVPLRRPMGARTASTITASRTSCSFR